MKKLATILLVLFVFTGVVLGLDMPGKKPIKGKLVEILFKKFYEITPIDAQDGIKGSGFKVYKVDEPKFKDYQAYCMYFGPIAIGKSGGRRHFPVLVKDEKVYSSLDFNKLLKDSSTKIDKKNFKEILKVFYQLSFGKTIKIFYIKWKDKTDNKISKKDSFDYDIEAKFIYLPDSTIFYDKFKLKDGYLFKLKVNILDSKNKKKIHKTYIRKFDLAYNNKNIRNKSIYIFKGDTSFNNPASFIEDERNSYMYPVRYFCEKNILIRKDDVYQSDNALNQLVLFNFPPHSTVNIRFKSVFDSTVYLFPPDSAIVCSTNDSGSSIKPITFPSNIKSGKYEIIYDSMLEDINFCFFIYDSKETLLTSN